MLAQKGGGYPVLWLHIPCHVRDTPIKNVDSWLHILLYRGDTHQEIDDEDQVHS